MKYITTDKHPELKEGIMLEYSTHGGKHFTLTNMYGASSVQVDAMLQKGYIKEVEEPEFTKSDMISFASYWDHGLGADVDEYFNDWLKEKK